MIQIYSLHGHARLLCHTRITLRSTRTIRTFITSILTSLMMTFITLITTPYLIHWLGTGQYGLYRITLDWVGYLTILDLGLHETLIPVLIAAHGKADSADVKKAIIAGFRAYAHTLPLKMLAGSAFIIFITHLIPSQTENIFDMRAGCIIGIIGSLFSPLQPFRTVLEVKQAGYRVQKAIFIKTLLSTTLALFFAMNKYGIKGQFFAVFVGDIFYHISISAFVLSHYPGLAKQLFVDSVDPTVSRAIWKLNVTNFISNICARISEMTDNIIISIVMSTSQVTPYVVSQRLVNFANLHLFGISNATWASLAHIHHQGRHESFRRRFIEINKLIVTIGLITLGPIAIFNRYFINFWLGAQFYTGDSVSFVASVNSILVALIAYWSWMFSAKGVAKLLLGQYIIYSLLNFTLSIVFTHNFGVIGPPLGTLLSIFSVTFWVTPRLLRKHFYVPISSIYFGILYPVLVLTPLITVIWYLSRLHPPSRWIHLIVDIAVSGFILTCASWFAILTEHERALWRHRVIEKLRLVQ